MIARDVWIFRLSKPGKKAAGWAAACRVADGTVESAGEVFGQEHRSWFIAVLPKGPSHGDKLGLFEHHNS